MPGYKGHLVGGVIAFGLLFFGITTVFVPEASPFTIGEWFLFALAGALFPDIDVKSKGQKYFYYVVLMCLVVLAVRQEFEMLTCFSFIVITPMLARHRGIFHNPRFVIAMPLIVWIIVAMVAPITAKPLLFDTLFFIAGA